MTNEKSFISEIRIYAEVIEQGLYFKDYFNSITKKKIPTKIILAKKGITRSRNSKISLLRNQKKFDLLVSIITSSYNKEIPILLVEFSTAVKTDDHEWQRFDGLFWANFFEIPYLKISSKEKKSQTAGDDFGGGSNLSIEDEIYIMQQNRCIMFHINWDTLSSSEYLLTHEQYLSCPPYNQNLETILKKIIQIIVSLSDPREYFIKLLNIRTKLEMPENFNSLFPPPESTRLKWNEDNNEFTIKINRFGHGMDPEKGGIAFFNMLTRSLNYDCKIISEFQIQRNKLTGRGSYKSLFDALSKEEELLDLVNNLLENNDNNIDVKRAISIFKLATLTDDLFEKKENKNNQIIINDTSLKLFLENSGNSTIKNILFYSDAIILTNLNRKIILKIEWNKDIVENYYENLRTNIDKILRPLPLRDCKDIDINEDLITYSCVQILKNIGLKIIAVSYPNAQGDRCVLIGEGRNIKRKYIDIIAFHEDPSVYDLFLQENKVNLNNKSVKTDIEKITDIIDSYQKNLLILIQAIYPNNKTLAQIYIGLGGKSTRTIKSNNRIDYVILIDLTNSSPTQNISWSIGVINLNILKIFKSVIKNNKIQGSFELPTKLFIVNSSKMGDVVGEGLDKFLSSED